METPKEEKELGPETTWERCPRCSNDRILTSEMASFMIQCDSCDKWFHGVCVSLSEKEANCLESYYCIDCNTQFEDGNSQQRRKSGRIKTPIYGSTYSELNEGIIKPSSSRWRDILLSRSFKNESFPRMAGSHLWDYVHKEGFIAPIIISTKEGLDLTMPSPTITVYDIAQLIGSDYPLEAMEVATQNESHEFTLGSFAEYFHSNPNTRTRIINVLSLEVSDTALEQQIVRPSLVRNLDWTALAWPASRKQEGDWPKVQLYCLMSVAGCYTDFHIDFGGSSVFYQVLSGMKTFYFIPPTEENLKKYEHWSKSSDQSSVFFADKVKTCFQCNIHPGETMFIPAGWIHAVYTPVDSIVIGGNFIHGLAVEMQWRIYEIEDRTKVEPKFRFPYFMALNWYAARYYLSKLNELSINVESDENSVGFSTQELNNITILVKKLATHVADPKGSSPDDLQMDRQQLLRDLLRLALSSLNSPVDVIEKESLLLEGIMRTSHGSNDAVAPSSKCPENVAESTPIKKDGHINKASNEPPEFPELPDLSHLADTDKVDDAIIRAILGSSSEDEAIDDEEEEAQDANFTLAPSDDENDDVDEIETENGTDEESEQEYGSSEADDEDEDLIDIEDDDDGELDSEDERNVRKRGPRKPGSGVRAVRNSKMVGSHEGNKKRMLRLSKLDKKKMLNKRRLLEDRSAPSEVSSAETGGYRVTERPLRPMIAMQKAKTEVIGSGDELQETTMDFDHPKTTNVVATDKPEGQHVPIPIAIPRVVLATTADAPKVSVVQEKPVVAQPKSLASLLAHRTNLKYTTKRR